MWYLLLFIVLIVLAYVFYQKTYGGAYDENISFLTAMKNTMMGGGGDKTVAEWFYLKIKPSGNSDHWNRRICRALSDSVDEKAFDTYHNAIDTQQMVTPAVALQYSTIIKEKTNDINYVSNFITDYLISSKARIVFDKNPDSKNIYELISPITKLYQLLNAIASKELKEKFIKTNVTADYKKIIELAQVKETEYLKNRIASLEQQIASIQNELQNQQKQMNNIPVERYGTWLKRLDITL